MLNDRILQKPRNSNEIAIKTISGSIKNITSIVTKLNNKNNEATTKKENIIAFNQFAKMASLNKENHENGKLEVLGVNFPFPFNQTKVSVGVAKNNKANQTAEIHSYKIDDQGDTNACGTTSLTSVLRYYGANVKDHWQIDKDIRSTRFDMFTAPGAVIDFAKSKGFNAGMKNDGDVEQLAKYVDKGVPPMVLIDSTPDEKYDTGLHWEVVTGYQRDNKGKISHLKIADPSGGNVELQDVNSFKKEWGSVKIGEDLPLLGKKSVGTGYNNMFIVITPKNTDIKAPDGKKVNTTSVIVPHDHDTVTGKVAKVFAKGAKLADDVITFEQKVEKAFENTVHNGVVFVEHKIKEVEHEVISVAHSVENAVSGAINTIENKVSNFGYGVKDKVSQGISLVSGLFD